MTHLTIEECIKCKFTDCVSVCPVDCFHEGKNFLVINPEKCIDCAVCIPECPVEGICESNNSSVLFSNINFHLSKIWPIITISGDKKIFDKWKSIKIKLHLINI